MLVTPLPKHLFVLLCASSYSITGGSLPTGITLNATTGELWVLFDIARLWDAFIGSCVHFGTCALHRANAALG